MLQILPLNLFKPLYHSPRGQVNIQRPGRLGAYLDMLCPCCEPYLCRHKLLEQVKVDVALLWRNCDSSRVLEVMKIV
jgi:hypothetical protein